MFTAPSSSIRNDVWGHPGQARLTIGLVAFLFLPLVGCQRTSGAGPFGSSPAEIQERSRRQELESELRDASAEEASLADAVRTATQESEEIDARIGFDRQALDELETTTRAYMREHDTAVAAILAGAASTDVFGDRQTSDEAKQVSIGVGVLVLLWATTHQEELGAVIRTLEAARKSRLSLQQDMQQAEARSNSQKLNIDDLKLKDGKARQKICLLRKALCGSGCDQKS